MAYWQAILYNINHAVGPNKPNVLEDVMLVQFLIKQAFGNDFRPVSVFVRGKATDLTPLMINGRYDANTQGHIDVFQHSFAREKGYHLSNDGIVDPIPPQLTRVPARRYTMGALNDLAEFHLTSRFNTLSSDPEVPGPLREALGKGYR